VNLVHDVLDKQIIDRSKCHVGRVDGIALELRDGEPPRVAYVEAGFAVTGRRLARWLARLARGTRDAMGERVGGTTRIPWSQVTCIGNEIEVDLQAEETPALALERWLREHVVCKVPLT